MSTALATLKERHVSIRNSLEASRERLNAIIPIATGLTASRAIAICLDALVRNPTLLDCSPTSIVRSVIHASEIGLELGSPLGEAFLVPFNNKNRGLEASMMPGYRGFVKLIRGAPRVTIVKAVLVREGDDFDVDEGENRLHHKLGKGTERQRGAITFAYSRVWYEGGASQFEVMDREALDKIKEEAIRKAKGFTPWKGPNEGEMYKKCPLRRQAKWLDLSPLGRRCVELDSLEGMRRGELGALREGFSAERGEELKAMLKSQDAPVEVIDADFEEG